MRYISLALALILSMSLVACGSSAETPSAGQETPAEVVAPEAPAESGAPESPAAPASDDAPAAPETPADATKEQRTVSLLFTNDGSQDELWKQCYDYIMLQEELGITLDFSFATEEQLGVIIASNDLPDIVSPRQRFLPAIIENNLAMDIEPIIDSHIPNLNLDYFKTSNMVSKEFMGGPDKKLFFLGTMIGPSAVLGTDTSINGYVVRWDLYKQLGCPPINSDEDYIKILQDMVALFPKTPDGLPVYAMAGIDDFQWWYQRGANIREGETGNIWTFTGYLYSASYKNMELVNGYTNPNSHFWTDMKFYNKLWNLGLLDPDSFTMTSAERQEKTEAMQYVGFQWVVTDLYNEMVKTDPETNIGFIMIPSTNAVINANSLRPQGSLPTDCVFINSQSDNWEAAAEALNFYRDPEVLRVYWNGKKGVSWDYDETGKPYLTDKGINDYKSYAPGTPDFRKATGTYFRQYDWTAFNRQMILDDGYFVHIPSELEYRSMVLNPFLTDVAEYYNVSAPSAYYQSFIDDEKTIDWSNDYAQLVASGVNEIPMDIQRIMSNINEITYRSVPNLVMAATQEEFDALQQQLFTELEAANEPTAWEWCLNAFNDSKARVQPIISSDIAVEREKILKKSQR